MVVEREEDIGLPKGIGSEPLANEWGRWRLSEVGQGSLGQPLRGLPLEKLEGPSHFFFEEVDFFMPAQAPGTSF